MVAVFREVWRVLRDDGTCWLNLGDSYVSHKPRGNAWHTQSSGFGSQTSAFEGAQAAVDLRGKGYKDKDLLMIPARVAIALCDDGWYLRKDIIWAKPNPMPESVTDRPTSSHEHIFLLTKRPSYFYDADAVREGGVSDHPSGNGFKRDARMSYRDKNGARGSDEQWDDVGGKRNLRDVWTIATQPFSEAHFATFPPDLVERCVKAGTSERGACPACGAPWARTIETDTDNRTPYATVGTGPKADISRNDGNGFNKVLRADGRGGDLATKQKRTTGWHPTCECPQSDPVPCVVLDPFSGAGTTAMVSDRLGRDAIGIDLNPTYGEMARERLVKDAGMFAVFE
jgi:DNA modification methylase